MPTTGRAENSTAAGAQEQDTASRHPLLGGREVPSATTPGATERPLGRGQAEQWQQGHKTERGREWSLQDIGP